VFAQVTAADAVSPAPARACRRRDGTLLLGLV